MSTNKVGHDTTGQCNLTQSENNEAHNPLGLLANKGKIQSPNPITFS